ncbi:peptidoglycan-binding protein [Trueperella sp. LYQ141]
MKAKRVQLTLLIVCALLCAFWAGSVVSRAGMTNEGSNAEPTYAKVAKGALGKEAHITVMAQQEIRDFGINRLAGTLTFLAASGEFKTGDVLYKVDGREVLALPGTVPFYRDLARGISGEDVAQLNVALRELGFSPDEGSEFGARTQSAVRQWQESRGHSVTGSIMLGEVIAIPALPAALTFDPTAHILGASLGGGEPMFKMRQGEPQFKVVLTAHQSTMIGADVPIVISYQDLTWHGIIGQATTGEDGQITAPVTPAEGTSICAQDCGRLPASAAVNLTGLVTIVPQQSGLTVPVSALQLESGGNVYVMRRAGSADEKVPVKLLGSQDGVALITGVNDGDEVLIDGKAKQ